MKKYLTNIFATTGISLLLLSIAALAFHAKCIYVQTVFQTFGANVFAHLGLLIISKLELKYAFTETLLDIVLIISMLLILGRSFSWFTSTPIWVLLIMGFMMYGISSALNLLHMRHEAQEINALIQKRNGETAV